MESDEVTGQFQIAESTVSRRKMCSETAIIKPFLNVIASKGKKIVSCRLITEVQLH